MKKLILNYWNLYSSLSLSSSCCPPCGHSTHSDTFGAAADSSVADGRYKNLHEGAQRRGQIEEGRRRTSDGRPENEKTSMEQKAKDRQIVIDGGQREGRGGGAAEGGIPTSLRHLFINRRKVHQEEEGKKERRRRSSGLRQKKEKNSSCGAFHEMMMIIGLFFMCLNWDSEGKKLTIFQ